MEIYALYSKTKKRYFRPIFAKDVEEAKAQIVDLVISTNDQVIVNSLDDLVLCLLGEYYEGAEVTNPLTEFLEVDIRCDDLVRELPFPPMVRSKIFKLYGMEDEFSFNPANIKFSTVKKSDSKFDQCSEVKSDAET